jgi:hypothetical protein
MKLKDCLEVNLGFCKPLLRREPEKSWTLAYEKRMIPEMLYKFYTSADYFSFDKCPKFLNDNGKILFPHLETTVEIIKSSFEEYYELIQLMKKYDSDSYNPLKEIRKETFDESAPNKFNRCFQLLIINMYSVLDSSAEAIAIILSWGELGKGLFSSLVREVKQDLNKNKGGSGTEIKSNEDKYITDIKSIIKGEIIAENNNEWYELFKLYRDKQAHFRPFSKFSIQCKNGNFYHFLPRQWPYYFQQNMSFEESAEHGANTNLNELFLKLLMEQDVFEYLDGLYRKVFEMINLIFGILLNAFILKKDSGCNLDIKLQKSLESLICTYKFRQF